MPIEDIRKFKNRIAQPVTPKQTSVSSISDFKGSMRQTQQKSASISDFKNTIRNKTSNIGEFKKEKKKSESGGFWNGTMKVLGAAVSSASNAVHDTGNLIGYGIAKAIAPDKVKWSDLVERGNFHPIQNQIDSWTGRNQKTYSDFTNNYAKNSNNSFEKAGLRTIGYGSDMILDPLNKIKIAALTTKGIKASKVGKVALSVAEQAKNGERALLQIGNKSILPNVGNKVLQGSTKLNDWIRGNKYGQKAVTGLTKISGKVRPIGVARDEFKTFNDAKTEASNIIGYKSDKSTELATDIFKKLKERKSTQLDNALLLHAIEKNDKKLAPKKLQDLFHVGVEFKNTNEETWKKFGGSVLEGQGLSHIGTKAVEDQARKKALQGAKLFSPKTPQDIHRKWMKVNGEVMNIDEAGIKYMPDVFEKGKGGFFDKTGNPLKVEQASAYEINQALSKQGKDALFREDLPTVMAKMGISTARKEGGQTFLNLTKGIKSEAGQKLVNQTHERLSNVEAVNKVIGGFDKAQNLWKAQALVSPSYHTRNAVGNVWNNALAGVNPAKYFKQGKVSPKLMDEMKRMGVIGEGQYGKDITKQIENNIKGGTWNPLSSDFKLFRKNMNLGSNVEDNARIAHYLSKRAEGYAPKEAAKSVQKYLFDYSDLTWGEKNVLKRVLPFYTWTSKNVPLQVAELVKQPGKFSKIAMAKKQIEDNVDQPNEKYMSDYIKSGAPIRFRKDKDGTTQYLLLGAWLPAAAAMNAIANPVDAAKGMITPAIKTPLETMFNKSSFFKNSLGEASQIERKPGEKKNFLGFDISPLTKNAISSIRVANEIDKLNPFDAWGNKDKGSVWNKLGAKNASKKRGSRNSPDGSQTSRLVNMFVGKATNYDPKQAKFFYDRDTQDRVADYKSAIKEAQKNKQTEEIKKINQELMKFLKERN